MIDASMRGGAPASTGAIATLGVGAGEHATNRTAIDAWSFTSSFTYDPRQSVPGPLHETSFVAAHAFGAGTFTRVSLKRLHGVSLTGEPMSDAFSTYDAAMATIQARFLAAIAAGLAGCHESQTTTVDVAPLPLPSQPKRDGGADGDATDASRPDRFAA